MVEKDKMFRLADDILDIGDDNLAKGFMKLTSILNQKADDSYNIPNTLLYVFNRALNDKINDAFNYYKKLNINFNEMKDKEVNFAKIKYFQHIINKVDKNVNFEYDEKENCYIRTDKKDLTREYCGRILGYSFEEIKSWAFNIMKPDAKKEVVSNFNEAFKTFMDQYNKLNKRKDEKFVTDVLSAFRDDIFEQTEKVDKYWNRERFYFTCKELFFEEFSSNLIKHKFNAHENIKSNFMESIYGFEKDVSPTDKIKEKRKRENFAMKFIDMNRDK